MVGLSLHHVHGVSYDGSVIVPRDENGVVVPASSGRYIEWLLPHEEGHRTAFLEKEIFDR